MNLRHRIERLEVTDAKVNDPDRIATEFFTELHERKDAAAERIAELLDTHATEEQIALFLPMLKPGPDGRAAWNPLMMWVHSVAFGDTAIPDGIGGDAVRAVAAYLLSGRELWCFGACDGCGLVRPEPPRGPRVDPAVMAALTEGRPIPPPKPGPPCLHCGNPAWTWSTRLNEKSLPWRANRMKTLAERFAGGDD